MESQVLRPWLASIRLLLLSSSVFSSCGRGDEGHPSNAMNGQSERIKSMKMWMWGSGGPFETPPDPHLTAALYEPRGRGGDKSAAGDCYEGGRSDPRQQVPPTQVSRSGLGPLKPHLLPAQRGNFPLVSTLLVLSPQWIECFCASRRAAKS
ncbi:unnamed protein product [Boreogadus saida]